MGNGRLNLISRGPVVAMVVVVHVLVVASRCRMPRWRRRRRLLLLDQFPAPISMPLVAAPVVLLPVALRLGIIAVAAAGGGGRERRCQEQGRDLKQPAAAVPSSAAESLLLLLLLLLLLFFWFRRHARSFSLYV